jgi:hypothetical protein
MSTEDRPPQAWIIAIGEYSDYRVLAVCLGGKKRAKKIARALSCDAFVSAVPVLASVDEVPFVVSYEATLWLDLTGRQESDAHPGGRSLWPPTGAHARRPRPHQIQMTVSAATMEAAVKACREYGAELGAELATGVPVEQALTAFNERRGHNIEED